MDNEQTLSVGLQQPTSASESPNLGSYKSNYRKSLPSKIEQIEALIAGQDHNKIDILKRLYVKFYHLAGTSGTFGIKDVSDEAGKLVSLLQPVVDSDQFIESTLITDLERGVQTLRRIALEASSIEMTPDIPAMSPARLPQVDTAQQVSEVFLVDDDSDFANYMALFLEKLGHRVYSFSTSEDLLTVSQGIRPKVIIIDLVFQEGVVEGARVIKKVQRHQTTPVPVIFTSYRDDVQARVLAAGAQGTHFFKKPIDEDRLLLTLDRIAFKPSAFDARILLINSHLARGEKQHAVFQKENIDTLLVRNPLQVFEALDQYQPDQIVIETAQLNSFQLAKAIRQHEAYQNIPMTLISGAPFETASLLAAEAGVDTLVPSSTPPEHIIRIIKARSERMQATVPEATIWQT